MPETMQEQQLSLFKKFSLDVETKKLSETFEEFFKVYPNVAYPFLLFNREKTIEGLKKVRNKLIEVGV